MAFRDRTEAGRALGRKLTAYAGQANVVVLALPRGGVPVAAEVARALDAPLDVFVVRKLGVPGHEELAMGALASGGVRVLNQDVVGMLGIGADTIDQITAAEQRELDRREGAYRGGRAPVDVAGKTVIVIDDGLATGATMRAAVEALRQRDAARIVVGVPVGAPESCQDLERAADDVVCAVMPQAFFGVGRWYQDFTQVTDEEVRTIIAQAPERPARVPGGGVKEEHNPSPEIAVQDLNSAMSLRGLQAR
jgi:predicted phosphoribosyltransferase